MIEDNVARDVSSSFVPPQSHKRSNIPNLFDQWTEFSGLSVVQLQLIALIFGVLSSFHSVCCSNRSQSIIQFCSSIFIWSSLVICDDMWSSPRLWSVSGYPEPSTSSSSLSRMRASSLTQVLTESSTVISSFGSTKAWQLGIRLIWLRDLHRDSMLAWVSAIRNCLHFILVEAREVNWLSLIDSLSVATNHVSQGISVMFGRECIQCVNNRVFYQRIFARAYMAECILHGI